MASVIENHLATGPPTLEGYCCICQDVVRFNIGRGAPWVSLRELIVCPQCHLNGRMRQIVTAIRHVGEQAQHRFLILERITPLFAVLQREYPDIRGCEYLGPNLPSGSVYKFHGVDVEHQDFLQLSYDDASIDLLVHGDVLEHVPDHKRALTEAARVVKPGGQMIFTCPFFDYFDEHLIRCRIEEGVLKHYRPPVYHGNPMSEQGSLVFIHPGWPLLDDIRSAGFSSVSIGLYYSPYEGIVSDNNPYPEGHMWPVIFRAIR